MFFVYEDGNGGSHRLDTDAFLFRERQVIPLTWILERLLPSCIRYEYYDIYASDCKLYIATPEMRTYLATSVTPIDLYDDIYMIWNKNKGTIFVSVLS